jgi:dephospho-CoA kinase
MKIAITGGIAEGKSTVLNHLKSMGATVASADEIAREILRNEDIQVKISNLAGVSEKLEPANIRLLLSLDDGFRRALNKLIHPLVIAEIEDSVAMFVEVPLLLETCMHASFEGVWVTTSGPDIQRQRLRERYPDKDHESIMATQISGSMRRVFADAVIPTGGEMSETLLAVEKEVKRWGLPLVVS